jgi:hypothetical protein
MTMLDTYERIKGLIEIFAPPKKSNLTPKNSQKKYSKPSSSIFAALSKNNLKLILFF